MASKNRKKRDPNSIPILTKKLDVIFSKYIRLMSRDRYGMVKCYTCDYREEPKKLQAGHWIPRQHKVTRWEPWNVHPQCYACNMHFGGRPQEYRERLVDEYGEEEVEEMALRRHEVRQFSRDELKELIEEYKAKVTELEMTIA